MSAVRPPYQHYVRSTTTRSGLRLEWAMIKSFKDSETEALFNGVSQKRFKSFERPAFRKLKYLSAAFTLNDLRIPPGNRLEALSGDRKGQYSIRINDQYRICFVWNDGAAYNVEIVDYH